MSARPPIRQREPRLLIPALLEAVRTVGECTLAIPVICIGGNHVAGAHSNKAAHGKGKGVKAHDCYLAAACQPCHDYIDRTRDPERWEIMQRGMDRTLYLLFEQGAIKVVRR